MAHQIPVLKRRSLEVAASYGSTTGDRVTEPIVFPSDIFPDTGEVSAVLTPSVIGNTEGAFRYIRDYDYALISFKCFLIIFTLNAYPMVAIMIRLLYQ